MKLSKIIFFKIKIKYYHLKKNKIKSSKNKTNLPNSDNAWKLLKRYRSFPEYNLNVTNMILAPIYDLTIIVPTYNNSNTIERCIDSIINQKTEFKFVVKIINDGSTDDTNQILNQYNNKPNITIINQKNMGRSNARNTGLEKIESKYIMFVDSDDYLSSDCIEKLLSKAFSDNLDIVEGNYNIVKNNKINKICIHKKSDASIKLTGYPWNKVFKSEIFSHNKFLPKLEFEDTLFEFIIYPYYKRIGIIYNFTYNYCINKKGITQTVRFTTKAIDSFYITYIYITELLKVRKENPDKFINIFLNQIIRNYSRTYFLNENINKSIFELEKEMFDEYFFKCKKNHSCYNLLVESLRKGDYRLYKKSTLSLM